MLIIFMMVYLAFLLMIIFGICDNRLPKYDETPPDRVQYEDKLVKQERERVARSIGSGQRVADAESA